MIRYLIKKIKAAVVYKNSKEKEEEINDAPFKLSSSMRENVSKLKKILGDSNDVVVRDFTCGPHRKMKVTLIYIDGLIDKRVINDDVMKPLMYQSKYSIFEDSEHIFDAQEFKRILVSAGDVKETDTSEELLNGCMSGDAALIIDGFDKGLIISCRGWDMRGVEDPQTESVIRGPREGFNENMRTNTALIRRKIKDPALTFEVKVMGKRTKTNVCIAYIRGIANQDLIDTVKERMDKIDTDAILESGYIEQYIEDAPYSIFPTLGYSEKPDVVSANLLEGRVAIIVDGTPFVLTAPLMFIETFQTAEDYYARPYYASAVRILRFISFGISVLAPAVYVALVAFHQELIPTPLLFTMAKAMEGTPFPAAIEALIMLVTFEILREAGVRLPRPVGQAISIVGALVMGQSAVSAGIVGTPMVIVVAITAVASFVVPEQSDAGAVLRFFLLLLASTMGGFGITMGLLIVLIHLSSLESFGTPYLSPLAPMRIPDLKDSIVRAPLRDMITRPLGLARQNPKRQKKSTPPSK